MPDETEKLVRFIFQQGPLIVSRRSNSPVPAIIEEARSITNKVYICLDHLINQTQFNKIAEKIYYVDFTTSPVIEFSSPIDRGDSLSRGRLYIKYGYDGRDGWFPYQESLAQLYRKIIKYFKKNILTRQKYLGAYCSKQSLEFKINGPKLVQLEIVARFYHIWRCLQLG